MEGYEYYIDITYEGRPDSDVEQALKEMVETAGGKLQQSPIKQGYGLGIKGSSYYTTSRAWFKLQQVATDFADQAAAQGIQTGTLMWKSWSPLPGAGPSGRFYKRQLGPGDVG